MPDPLSIALGVVQVAETGFKLADSIYKYTNSVRKAEEQFRPIADYVKLTCTVLEQIASHLQDEDLTALYKPALLASAQDAIQGCEKAFDSLSVYLTTLTKDGNANGVSISTKTRFAWTWKRKELDNHQVHLERYKSTFDLLLSTLTFVSSSRTAKDTLAMKIELQRLMNVEAEAKKKEALLPSIETTEPRALPRYTSLPDTGSTRGIDAADQLQVELSSRAIGSTALGFMNTVALPTIQALPSGPMPNLLKDSTAISMSLKNEQTDVEDALLARLNDCASAMEKLSATLNETISQWEQSRRYQRESLLPSFQLLHSAIKRVSALELLDTRAGSHGSHARPVSSAKSCVPQLVPASNDVQTSRSQHFRYEPISPPSSRSDSPVRAGAEFSSRRNMTAGFFGPIGNSLPPSGDQSPAGTPASTAPGTPRPRTSAIDTISSRSDQSPKFQIGPSDDSWPLDGKLGRSGTPASTAPAASVMTHAPTSVMGQFNARVSPSSQRKHVCNICDKRFTLPSSLQTHMYSHFGEKPFACDVEGCGRRFAEEINLQSHRKAHGSRGQDHLMPASRTADVTGGAPSIFSNGKKGGIQKKTVSALGQQKFTLPDYYKDLEISAPASLDDVQKAYRKLVLRWHPDRNPGKENEVITKFETIRKAQELLTDPVKKRKYDNDRQKAGLDPSSSFLTNRSNTSHSATFSSRGRNPHVNLNSNTYQHASVPVALTRSQARREDTNDRKIMQSSAPHSAPMRQPAFSPFRASNKRIADKETSRSDVDDSISDFGKSKFAGRQQTIKRKKSWRCASCAAGFQSPQELKMHTETHFDVHETSKHSCGQCGQRFMHSEELARHMGERSRCKGQRSRVSTDGELGATDDNTNFIGDTYKREDEDSNTSKATATIIQSTSVSDGRLLFHSGYAGRRGSPVRVTTVSERSQSRFRRRSTSPTQSISLSRIAARGSLTEYASNEDSWAESSIASSHDRRRSRPRGRAVSVDSVDAAYEDQEHRNRCIAQAGLAAGAAAGLVEHVRSKSRERRPRSRTRSLQARPIAAAGLGDASLVGSYEKSRTDRMAGGDPITSAETRDRSRSRSRTRGHGHQGDRVSLRGSGEALAQPGLSSVAVGGLAGAAAAYGFSDYTNRNEERSRNSIESGWLVYSRHTDEESGQCRRRGGSAGSSPDDRCTRRSKVHKKCFTEAGADNIHGTNNAPFDQADADRHERRSGSPTEGSTTTVGDGTNAALEELQRNLRAYGEEKLKSHAILDTTTQFENYEPLMSPLDGMFLLEGTAYDSIGLLDSPFDNAANPQMVDKPHSATSGALTGALGSAQDGENALTLSNPKEVKGIEQESARRVFSITRRASLGYLDTECALGMAEDADEEHEEEQSSMRTPDLKDVDELLKMWTLVEV